MKVSQLIGSTLRQVEGHTPGMAFLLRAGYLRKPLSDTTVLLSLGQSTLKNISQAFCRILEDYGATQIQLPVLHTEDVWTRAGISDVLPQDSMAIFTPFISGEISSYRQLPQIAWQMRPALPSGSGNVLETWIVSSSAAGLQDQIAGINRRFLQLCAQWNLPVKEIVAESGLSCSRARSWVFPFEEGKTRYMVEREGDFAGEIPVTATAKTLVQPGFPLPAEKVYTPATATIQELANFLNIQPSQTAKVVFFTGKVIRKKQPQLIIAVIRGDREVNERAVRNHIGAVSLRAATEAEIVAVGCVPGFASPMGIRRENVIVIADDEVVMSPNLVAGANERDFHLKNVCYGRDYTADIVADITLASAGLPGLSGLPLEERRGMTLGKNVEPGTWYSDLFKTTYMSEQGRPEPFHLGYFQWDMEIILAALAEVHHDENGLIWPESIAPYEIALISLEDAEETTIAAAELYQSLCAAGKKVLFDDRNKKVAGPGVKFTDADLLGLPVRITVSKRTLAEGGVEIKKRNEERKEIVKREDIFTSSPHHH
ncbi:MAG: YbaK/EbsC family protein [Bacteroidia bacterium]|nr:YbaK/EbsC family protein [Bacteroidia bacterium]